MTQQSRNTIKDFPETLRPRERLLRDSAHALSDYELLAILLQSGSVQMNALELAQEVLKVAGGLQGLKQMSVEELCQIHGIGFGKAATILSLVELSNRMRWLNSGEEGDVIRQPLDAMRLFQSAQRRNHQEVFWVLYLDAKMRVISCEEVFVGTLNYSLVHLRDVFRNAVKKSAHSVLVGHNHPSGDIQPSEHDITLTKRLVEAGELMDIPVQDHIIVSDREDRFFSFKEERLM